MRADLSIYQDLTARDAPIANELGEEAQSLPEIILTEVHTYIFQANDHLTIFS